MFLEAQVIRTHFKSKTFYQEWSLVFHSLTKGHKFGGLTQASLSCVSSQLLGLSQHWSPAELHPFALNPPLRKINSLVLR